MRFITESGTQGKLESGKVSGLEMNNKPLKGDPGIPPGKIEYLNAKDLSMFSAGKTTWQNTTTGGDILAWVQDEDAFVARAASCATSAPSTVAASAASAISTRPASKAYWLRVCEGAPVRGRGALCASGTADTLAP